MNTASRTQLARDVRQWGARIDELPQLTRQAIADITGLSPAAQRVRRLYDWASGRQRQSAPTPPEPPEPPPLAAQVEGDQRARRASVDAAKWKRRYEHLLEEHDRLRAEHEAALGLTRSALEPVRIEPTTGSGSSEAVAIIVASDWHCEERVEAAHVNGRNAYNLEIAERRSRNFFDRALRMVRKERQDVRIHTVVLALLGDFITGRIHEENLETCDLRPMDAILFAQRLLGDGIRFLLEHSDLNLVIPCRPGNHSRITKRVHAATEDGNALETLMYAALAQMFAGERRVRFELQPSYHALIDVFGHTVRLHHGHAVQYGGGVGGLHIPLRKALAQWDGTQRALVDCLGHWHTYAATTRRYVVNGSLIGVNAYSIRIKADYEPPIQAFLLLDRKRGVTVQLPLLVDD